MRILSIILIGLFPMMSIPEALASQWEGQMRPHINCCMLGQCLKTRRQNCEQKKGRVVENCDQCKVERDTNKPENK